jgi:predicted nucleic acid-binding protein
LVERGDQIVVSHLVRMECRVGPLAAGDAETLALFDRFFVSGGVQVVGITATICDRAAAIRARYGFRAMDALHLAASIEHGCQRFLTSDRRLDSFPEIAIEILS